MTSPQAQDLPEFWHISYPIEFGDGGTYYLMANGTDEQNARIMAAMYSRQHGHATVTNRQGLVATYVTGVERHFQLKPVQAKTSRGNFLTKLRSLLK